MRRLPRYARLTSITAPDGKEAVRAALERAPDIIVMDLAMPQFDGISAMRLIRAEAETAAMRMILLTGYPRPGLDRAAYEAGAERVLTKPCLPEVLEKHVAEVLGGRTPA